MVQFKIDMDSYKKTARAASAEGCVLLENENRALPLRAGDKIAVFGRTLFRYYKSGLGSGGLVNTRYEADLLEAFRQCPEISLDEKLLGIYEAWIAEHPYDEGQGWGKVPWAQEEMPVTEEMLSCAKDADACVIFIGRTAGEDQDNKAEAGSYCLSAVEEELIEKVCKVSDRVIVALNVGNIMDMNWVKMYHPQAVIYIWQGGQEGANAALDVLTGRVNPSGHLTDTIAKRIEDYPAASNFGSLEKNFYKEDVYVGYRYFETFAKDAVLYPFGYGLSYTTFEMEGSLVSKDQIKTVVKNTGDKAGKTAIQVYIEVPQGKLGNPARKLVGFKKTSLLEAGDLEELIIDVPPYTYASYDDSGITGHRSAYVLENGTYTFFVGEDIRSAKAVGSFEEAETIVLEQLREAYAPTEAFSRMKPAADGSISYENVPLRTVDMRERLISERPAELPYTGDKGISLVDVMDGRGKMDDFISQLSDEDLLSLFHAEGMCSSKVTPGTASAFGGLTPGLKQFGIPAACCADGPSGIRMDCGTIAFSLPNGTSLGCTFNTELNEELYRFTGREVRRNKIDSLLGPGMNIHRHPLNGRNFEYISEDPLLTGKICAAQVRAMAEAGVGSTIKHFCGNNQEAGRSTSDSIISERALREIYLKGFEIAVKEGGARSVMTTYGSVNGLWTSGSYDLCTTILRGEWGFDGIVMTDWWAVANYEDYPSDPIVKAPMIAAQNDLFMVCNDASDLAADDAKEEFDEGWITRAELQRNAANILRFIIKSPSILHLAGRISEEELEAMKPAADEDGFAGEVKTYEMGDSDEIVLDGSELHVKHAAAEVIGVVLPKAGFYSISITQKSELNPLAQLSVSVFMDNVHKSTISMTGTEGKAKEYTGIIGPVRGETHFIKLFYRGGGMSITRLTVRRDHDIDKE